MTPETETDKPINPITSTPETETDKAIDPTTSTPETETQTEMQAVIISSDDASNENVEKRHSDHKGNFVFEKSLIGLNTKNVK